MNRVVLDASALLAILHEEPGAETFTRQSSLLEDSVMSAVNVAEVYGKLVGVGISSEEAWEAVTSAIPEIVDFDREQAKVAGGLVPQTRSLGLSLGDRACLALGIALKAPVYTADRAWKNLKLKISIHVIR
ncbi:MAG: type II toxin-antitoxin system VapC family toxin [Candidatus Sulfotelmatobacter sp.]